MESRKIILYLISITLGLSLYCCKTEEIILHGDITGIVSDASTNEPVNGATVILDQSFDTINTENNGSYLINSITPGDYIIKASKSGYGISTDHVTVESAVTKKIDFHLNEIPEISLSDSLLDFGLDSTSLSFTISRTGRGKLIYVLGTSKNWINVNHSTGEVKDETDTITVTIDKTGLSDSIYRENITVTCFTGQGVSGNAVIDIYMNGALDNDGYYYKVVKIGTQTWLAENLRVGTCIPAGTSQLNNGIIEKYCGSSDYGGYYQWNEMMQYSPSDNKLIGTTRGVCPAGWHIPTSLEWNTLIDYIGGSDVAAGKLKETGYTHWQEKQIPPPGFFVSNEFGFTALGGGFYSPDGTPMWIRNAGCWWTSAETSSSAAIRISMTYDRPGIVQGDLPLKKEGASVRCVKD